MRKLPTPKLPPHLVRLHQIVRDLVDREAGRDVSIVEAGQALAELKAAGAFRHTGCSSWKKFCKKYYGWDSWTADRYVKIGQRLQPQDVAGKALGVVRLYAIA